MAPGAYAVVLRLSLGTVELPFVGQRVRKVSGASVSRMAVGIASTFGMDVRQSRHVSRVTWCLVAECAASVAGIS